MSCPEVVLDPSEITLAGPPPSSGRRPAPGGVFVAIDNANNRSREQPTPGPRANFAFLCETCPHQQLALGKQEPLTAEAGGAGVESGFLV